MNARWNALIGEPHSSLDIKLITANLRNHTLGYTLER
jgi:hypothetical protein